MVAAPRTPRRDSVAIAGSIAVHLCVLAVVLATWPRASFPVNDPDERTLLTSIVRIEHHEPPKVVPTKPRVAVVAAQPVPQPVIHAAVTVEHASHKMIVAAEHRAGAMPAPQATAVAKRAHALTQTRVAVAQQQPVATVQAVQSSAPVASPAPSPVAAQHEEGIGNFGETYPAAVDPSARGTLMAGISGVVVRVAVDENGRATAIEFLRPPADAAQREELRLRLLAAHFIPAACNGLRCAGTVELRT
jgi:hypothetical protein